MTSNPDAYKSAVLARRIARIRVVVATSASIFMFAVSAGIVLLFRYSDPSATGFTNTENITLLIATVSAVVFVCVGILLYRGRAGVGMFRGAEVVLWLDFIVLGVSAIALLAIGSASAVVWIAAIGFGFDLARQLRQGPLPRAV
ncbi:hypothetical protein [Nocardia tenerifensis]|uniref:hypothetical protein n=1 Tax=Nocardia tenerifensis TaxID=228006 RepID=UPI0011B425E7|nr:hypothetical protein [Nocardia tenerifensis]